MRRLWVIVPVVIVLGAGALVLQQRAQRERAAHKARETALAESLMTMRKAISNFYQDNNRYPGSLEELVPKYMRSIPADPMTSSLSWRLTTEETVQPSDDFSASAAPKTSSVIVDVHSSAPGYTDY
jgi:general secretion pathway protein G